MSRPRILRACPAITSVATGGLLLLLVAGLGLGACARVDASQQSSASTSGGAGGGGGSTTITCTWTSKENGATCASGSCPITLDEELACADTEFAAPGVRVAPGPDATWVATSSTNDRLVYRLADGARERQDGLPEGFARATLSLALGPDGTPHLAADATEIIGGDVVTYKGGAMHSVLVDGAWQSSLVHKDSEGFTPVLDMEVGSDGAPRVWVASDALSSGSLAIPTSQGGWALTKVTCPGSTQDGCSDFALTSGDAPVSLGYEDAGSEGASQLHAVIGGVDRAIGSAANDALAAATYTGATYGLVTAAPAPSATSPLLVIAEPLSDGVHVFAELAAAPEIEAVVTGLASPVPTCTTPADDQCSGSCHETSAGLEDGAYALAETSDGTAWFAYVVTSFDQTIDYGLQGDPGGEFCVGNIASDTSQGTLHLVRVPIDGSAPGEVLTMPIERPGTNDMFDGSFWNTGTVRFLDARGFGSDLAIGLRTGWGTHAVRVLRIDTTKL